MGQSRPVKLVHHVPLALSINNTARSDDFIGGQDLEITAMTLFLHLNPLIHN